DRTATGSLSCPSCLPCVPGGGIGAVCQATPPPCQDRLRSLLRLLDLQLFQAAAAALPLADPLWLGAGAGPGQARVDGMPVARDVFRRKVLGLGDGAGQQVSNRRSPVVGQVAQAVFGALGVAGMALPQLLLDLAAQVDEFGQRQFAEIHLGAP